MATLEVDDPAVRPYPPTRWTDVQARAVALVSAFADPCLSETYREVFDEAAGTVNEARATIEVLVVFVHRLIAEHAERSGIPTSSVRAALADPFEFTTQEI